MTLILLTYFYLALNLINTISDRLSWGVAERYLYYFIVCRICVDSETNRHNSARIEGPDRTMAPGTVRRKYRESFPSKNVADLGNWYNCQSAA